MDNTTKALILFVVIGIAVWIYSKLKEKKNIGLAQNGEDMRRLQEAVARVLPNESGYQVVFAHWEKVEYYGRTRRTTYYSYALAFDDARLWVIPLGFQKDDIRPGQPILLTKESLGIAEVDTHMKNDLLNRVSVTLRDKDGKSPVNLEVDALNLRSDRFHHLNIDQTQECAQFSAFIAGMSDTVARENAGLEDRLHSEMLANSSKGSKTLGIVGIALFWTGFIGLIFGGIGLLNAPKPAETQGKAETPYILCLIATILSALATVVGIAAIALF